LLDPESILGGMGFRIEIKHRATPPKPWKWEIYEDAKPLYVKQSAESFASRPEAKRAGEAALGKFRRSTSARRNKNDDA